MRFMPFESRQGRLGFIAPAFTLWEYLECAFRLGDQAGLRCVGGVPIAAYQPQLVTPAEIVAQLSLRQTFVPLPNDQAFSDHPAHWGVVLIQHLSCLAIEMQELLALGGGLVSPLAAMVSECGSPHGFLVAIPVTYGAIPVLDCCHLNGSG